MFQQLFRGLWGDPNFKVRSAERDAQIDRERVSAVVAAIEGALRDAENEQTGLSKRVDDALARAAVTIGNATDEYLDREPALDHHQSLFSIEISNGQRRLAELATMIANLRYMKETTFAHFPNFQSSSLES